MKLTAALYRNSTLLFAVFSILVLWGFWQTFFSNPLQVSGGVQLHGVAMSLWCVMLVAQAFLIRTNRRDLHRAVGKSSYVLAPLVIFSQLIIVPNFLASDPAISTSEGIQPIGMLFAQGILGMSVMFAGIYALAIINRRNAPIHARLMLCTPIVILAPATDRIIRTYFTPLLDYYPEYPGLGIPFEPLGAAAISAVLLTGLAIWDWRSDRRLSVFPPMFVVLMAYYFLNFNAHRLPGFESLCNWALGLPQT